MKCQTSQEIIKTVTEFTMESIKLHMQGNVAVIIIPANLIENTGWGDGVLLDVINMDGILHIQTGENKFNANCANSDNYALKYSGGGASSDVIYYTSELNPLVNKLPFFARRIFFLCLAFYNGNRLDFSKPILIRAGKYAKSVGVDKPEAYKQMKDAADYFLECVDLAKRCNYVYDELIIEFNSNIIDRIREAYCYRKNRAICIPLKSALSLSTIYSWNLYRLIKINIPRGGKFYISVNNLINELNTFIHMDYINFRKVVISLAIDEIVKKTEITSIRCINVEKKDRGVSKVCFEIDMR